MKNKNKKYSEASFTLFETLIALGILATLMIQIASVQGNALNFADYGRNAGQASWLAKAKMAQVEYYASTRPWNDLITESKGEFADYPGFKWELKIEDWKLPLQELLTGKGGGDGDGEGEKAKTSSPMDAAISQVFGKDSLLRIARVVVSWPAGAVRDDISLSYLLTNQSKLDQTIASIQLPEAKPANSTPPPGGPPSDQGGKGSDPKGDGKDKGKGAGTGKQGGRGDGTH